MLSLEEIQEGVLTLLQSSFVQPVVEQAIPDRFTVQRDKAGKIKPYLAIQFGDISQQGSRAMIGPTGDDYVLPLYIQSVAPDAKTARKLSNKVVKTLLGISFPWSGSMRKRPGGGYYPIVGSDGATEAYQSPTSFGLVFQFVSDDT